MTRFSVFYLALVALSAIAREAYADAPERIVGGTIATAGEFPYQVSIREGVEHVCGGSIISDRHILTAAHCINDWVLPDTYYSVVTGTNSIKSGGEVHNVKAISVHQNYQGGRETSWINDIAIILLEKPLKFNNVQKTIELFKTELPLSAHLRLSGWGRIYKDGPLSNALLKADMYPQDKILCQRTHREKIYSSQICAVNNVGIGACQGDSGGPLAYNGQLAGIVSWVIPCGTGFSDVFTKVSSHLDYIETTMKTLK